ncbi:hypothetical protein K1719_002851 [Acacia pycnantha]|nr:hypothetical protein K1719_002851 [Acacia pycnantha]
MIIIRSFDVNKPGAEVDDIEGGVAGGSILKGVLKVNQLIEIQPRLIFNDEKGNKRCTPIYSRIVSLYAEQNELQFAVPGGLIGVGTAMDPTLTRADRLVGHVLGEVGSLPDVYVEIEQQYAIYLVHFNGIRHVIVENFESSVLLGGSDFIPFDPTTFGMSLPTSNTNDILLPFPFLVNLSLWLYFTLWCVLLVNFFVLRRLLGVATKGPEEQVKVKNDLAKLQLTIPVCTNRGEKIALSRCIKTHWRLIGWGQIQVGTTLDMPAAPILG